MWHSLISKAVEQYPAPLMHDQRGEFRRCYVFTRIDDGKTMYRTWKGYGINKPQYAIKVRIK